MASGISKPLLCHLLDVHKVKRKNLRRREDERKTHPRDSSLSVSNPTRALDTLSGYHGRAGRKTYEMTEEKASNEKSNTGVQKTVWEPREKNRRNPVFVRQSTENINY